VLIAAGVVAVSVVYLLAEPRTWHLWWALAGAAGSLPLWRAWRFTSTHLDWTLPALMLVFLLISLSVLGDGLLRAGLHYGVATLLCVPVVPAVWSSGILKKEGFRLYAIYFLWALATVAYSSAPLFTISRLAMSVLVFLAVTFAATKLDNAEDLRRLFARIAIACGVVVVANAVALPILGAEAWQVPLDDKGLPLKDPTGEVVQRFTGFMGNPNALGTLMLVTVCCALVSIPYTSGRSRTTLLITSIAALVLAALADSRSSFAALGIGVLLFFLFRYRSRALAAMGILLLFAMAALPLLGPALMDHVTRGDVGTLTGRTDIWEFVVREIRARPLVGYGYETAGQIFQSRYFPIWWGPWELGPQSSLHNGFLNRAIGMGIPATLFWLFIVLRPWFSLARQDEDTFDLKPVLALLVIPMLIINLTESAISDFAEMNGFLFGIAWAAAEMQRIRWLEKRAKSIVERQRGETSAVAALRSLSRA
jgi:hypothetical protein